MRCHNRLPRRWREVGRRWPKFGSSPLLERVLRLQSALSGMESDERLALELFHGRSDPEHMLVGWGSQGPVFLVRFATITYLSEIRFEFGDDRDEGSLQFVDDLVYYDGTYYGDWSLFPVTLLGNVPDLAARLQNFDHKSAVPPQTA